MTPAALCPLCRSEIDPEALKCRHCGEWIRRSCEVCGTPIRGEWAARGWCADCPSPEQRHPAAWTPTVPARSGKSRGAAGFLALFLGGLGAHKFYVGKPGVGLVYLIFFWTFIPALVGLVESIRYFGMSDEEFERNLHAGGL